MNISITGISEERVYSRVNGALKVVDEVYYLILNDGEMRIPVSENTVKALLPVLSHSEPEEKENLYEGAEVFSAQDDKEGDDVGGEDEIDDDVGQF
jgi:hypothetical protein